MKRIASCSWGSNRDSMVTFYKAFIGSKLEYRCEVYVKLGHPHSSKKKKKKKIRVDTNNSTQNSHRSVVSSPTSSPQVECNIPPLEYWRKIEVISYSTKRKSSNIEHPVLQTFSTDLTIIDKYNWSSNKQVHLLIRADYALTSLALPSRNFSPLPVCSLYCHLGSHLRG